jgi:gp26
LRSATAAIESVVDVDLEAVEMQTKRKRISQQVRCQVYEMYGGRCAYCGRKIDDIQKMRVDHVYPLRKGGENALSNYKPACRKCNYYKSTLDIEQFREYVGTVLERLEKVFIFHIAMQYGVITETDKAHRLIRFYFEELENAE